MLKSLSSDQFWNNQTPFYLISPSTRQGTCIIWFFFLNNNSSKTKAPGLLSRSRWLMMNGTKLPSVAPVAVTSCPTLSNVENRARQIVPPNNVHKGAVLFVAPYSTHMTDFADLILSSRRISKVLYKKTQALRGLIDLYRCEAYYGGPITWHPEGLSESGWRVGMLRILKP